MTMVDTIPLVSVILPTYNCANFLTDSITSVLSQTYSSYEIIVVDDGSTDNTKEVLNPFMQRIKYICHHQNKGAPGARNTGIQSAQGKYIAFLDADDIWLPEKLHISIEYFNKYPDIGMVYSGYVNIDENGYLLNRNPRKQLPSGNIFIQLFSEQNFIITPSVVVSKEVFKTTGLFDEQFFHCDDWDMWLRIAFHFKVIGINKPIVKCRHRPHSLRRNCTDDLRFQKMVIDKTYNTFKDKETGLNQKLYEKRLALQYAKVGRYYLRTKNIDLAYKHFRLSLKYNPFNLRTIRYYFYTRIHSTIKS